jgi:pseudo-rSAM protein
MIERRKQYWFYIETYVHISLKKDSLILYNSLSGEALEYLENEEILNLVKKLKSPKNLQVILLNEKELTDPDISQFVNDVRRSFMGDLIDRSYSKGKPVQMMAIIKIKKDVKYLKRTDTRSVGEDLMESLNQIFLYINDECEQDCDICSKGYKQYPCCTTKKNGKGEQDITKIKKLLEEISSCPLINLNILGGDIFKYSKFKELTGIINHLPAQKIYHAHYLNVTKENSQLKFLNPRSSSLKILVPFPVNEEKLKSVLEIVMNTRLSSKFVFILQSEEEFEKAEFLISSLQIADHEFQPFFNGKNLDFFMEGVFTEKEEILTSKPKMKDIYANSVVNSLNFGRLTILSNGHIHANVNAPRLGILGKDSIYDVLYKEMYHGKSWRRVRKNVDPCKHCTFQALCPPLSNYTYAMGRNNLCHTNP